MCVLNPLALRVPHQLDEPPPYYAARLAARNLRPTRMFAMDMGINFQRLADGCTENVKRLAELSGADYSSLISSALRKRNGRTIELKGQQLQMNGLRRSRLSICAQCLLNDIAESDLDPQLAIYGRAHWMLGAIRTCPIHEVALVQATSNVSRENMHDWTRNVGPVIPRLQELANVAIHRPASALEKYLLHRLERAPTNSWLNVFPLFAAEHVAELIGAVAIAGIDVNMETLDETARYEAGHAGAEIAHAGQDAVIALMTRLKANHFLRKAVVQHAPRTVLGKLYTIISHGLSDTAYDPLRELMSTFILQNFAVGPGDTLFGKPVIERRLHSIRTASMEYNVHRIRMKKMLLSEGVITDPDALDGNILFKVEDADRIFQSEQGYISTKAAARYLEAGTIRVSALLKAGFIKRHRIKGGTIELFKRPELDDFLSSLLEHAVPVKTIPSGVTNILAATRRACCSITDIVQLILDRKLAWLGHHRKSAGLASVLVKLDEVKMATRLEEPPGLSLRAAEEALQIRDVDLAQFIRAGIINTFTATNPVNRCQTRFISMDEIERFKRNFVSLFQLARSQGRGLPAIKQDLFEKGIMPIFLEGLNATFYRRADVELVNCAGQPHAEGMTPPM